MYLLFCGKNLLLKRSGLGWELPRAGDISGIDYQTYPRLSARVELLAAINDANALVAHELLELVPLRTVLTVFPSEQIEQIVHAEQLLYYQQQTRFCSSCGTPLHIQTGHSWLFCGKCQREIYPTISPAMIVRVTRGDEILLAQANHFAAEQWSVLAGFCEVGESLEQTVAREVLEEVGITVKNIRYFGSQYWPFPHSLMVAFTAEYAGGEINLDTNEMRTAGFFTADKIPGRPSTAYSIANRLIDDFLRGI